MRQVVHNVVRYNVDPRANPMFYLRRLAIGLTFTIHSKGKRTLLRFILAAHAQICVPHKFPKIYMY